MRRLFVGLVLLVFAAVAPVQGYIEAPHTVGKCVNDSTNVVLLEIVRINTDKNLIIYKKLQDIKGKHPTDEVKHNIGKKGFHEREWKNVMAWAAVGKKAVMFYNNDGSETCTGDYWYQAYKEGDWWGMSHAEPFMLRTYVGDPEKLAEACVKLLKNEEVVVTCFADGSKNDLHAKKGKIQQMRASLKKLDYNTKRDFAGWGGEGFEIQEFKTITLFPESTTGWKYLPAKDRKGGGNEWIAPNYDSAAWRTGKAPIGYGEPEIATRKGTEIPEKGVDFVFRRTFELPADALAVKGTTVQVRVASDDSATVYLNGQTLDVDPDADHEFSYWNREIDVPQAMLKTGINHLAIYVRNKPASSDLYMDADAIVQIPLPKKPVAKVEPKTGGTPVTQAPLPKDTSTDAKDPTALVVDAKAGTITLACTIAARKLPNLQERYPIEVIATVPPPKGQKAHETIVTFQGFNAQDVHNALVGLGLKPGKPAYGEQGTASGPEVKLAIEWMADGKTVSLPLEKTLVRKTGNGPVPELKWLFTGSVLKQPDPEKDLSVYGANMTGTLISIFPVTDSTVFQSQLTMKDEASLKLESADTVLPKEGSPVKLIIRTK